MSGPRIAIIGGGSYQWVPKLLVDLANTPALREAEIVIEDIDAAPIPRMVALVEHIAAIRGIGLRATGTTDQRAALTGADFVVVSISTGGFDAMRHDLEVPERFGVHQSVGDTVGPGGIVRALRNVPVLVGIARDMEDVCPDAWMLNLTNPMTALCRAVTRETEIRTIGLCHEITIAQFMLSLMLDVSFLDLQLTVAGVNHLPFITAIDVKGADGFAMLRDLLAHADERGQEPLPMALPAELGHEPTSGSGDWTKADLLRVNQVKLECFRRYGVLPGAGDRHVAEFFADFLTPDTRWGADWGVDLTSIADREQWQAHHIEAFEALLAADAVDAMPSGELVAAVIQCMLTDAPGWFPLNLPNAGQVVDLPPEVVVESMCVVDGAGARGRDEVTLPAEPAAIVQRVARAQECTVEAALSGDRALVVEAMHLDPLTSRLDTVAIEAMADAMLDATSRWLPQFA
jgi:alpha-galactosidase